jgi:AAA15 family ATPase/GTPase
MLVEFTVSNFRSIKGPATLSLVAARMTSGNSNLDADNVAKVDDDLGLLRSAVIYGANASGKSNVISALAFMRRFVRTSANQKADDESIAYQPFLLDTRTRNSPSQFELLFLLNEKQYRYGFSVTADRVVSEWLYHVPRVKELPLFTRNGQDITVTKHFKEGKGLEAKTRQTSLFLSVVGLLNGPVSSALLVWFRHLNIISGLTDDSYRQYTIDCLQQGRMTEEIEQFVRDLDLSIEAIRIDPAEAGDLQMEFPGDVPQDVRAAFVTRAKSNATRIWTSHPVYEDEERVDTEQFLLSRHESQGTKKLFALAGPLLDTLTFGKTLVVDELDARLHPLLTRAIVRLFNSPSTNPRNAQLLFATHDTNLLSRKNFRRDQIWFTDKNRFGATQLYSLAEIRVRNDASFEPDYMNGKYGAIPLISDLVTAEVEDTAEVIEKDLDV